mmetsp:Transcript_15541/g.35826  ORF Transcript_15541/g.35826 Transcript_15541/m.35826 type:complete len:89 (+) Transcript_15541:174-440(+)
MEKKACLLTSLNLAVLLSTTTTSSIRQLSFGLLPPCSERQQQQEQEQHQQQQQPAQPSRGSDIPLLPSKQRRVVFITSNNSGACQFVR